MRICQEAFQKKRVIRMETTWISDAVQTGDMQAFYKSGAWLRKRREVLAYDHYECQDCKAAGRYTRAEMVHHEKHVRDRPDLALSMWHVDPATGERTRQLISLCFACHERRHPERLHKGERKPPVTVERW